MKAQACDGRCHSAIAGKCRCLCAGAFHGVDREAERIEFAARHGLDPDNLREIEIREARAQLPMFEADA